MNQKQCQLLFFDMVKVNFNTFIRLIMQNNYIYVRDNNWAPLTELNLQENEFK